MALPMDINQITYAINGAVLEVNRVLGLGFLEKVYENALLILTFLVHPYSLRMSIFNELSKVIECIRVKIA